jgi:pimeloyl-ACP methyl ester carboxylesterase
MRAKLSLLLSLLGPVLLVACASSESPVATPSARSDGEAAPVAVATPGAKRQWVIADPAFEALPGARALYGVLDGAAYQIEVPENWNGSLVLYAHGFQGFGSVLSVSPPPLREHFIAYGHAWAASSYRENGYVPGIGVEDTLALRDLFIRKVGQPRLTYLYGISMGGHVVVSSLELHPNVYDGALAECGVVTGVEILDFLAGYALVAEYVAGVQLPLETDEETLTKVLEEQILPALGNPEDGLTERGRRFESVMTHLTGGPRPWRRQGFALRFEENLRLALEGHVRGGVAARAASNAEAVYHIDPGLGISDDELNSGVRRLDFDPKARDPKLYPAFAPIQGRLEEPFLSIHTTGDFFVPFSLEQSYRRKVEASGAGELLVQRAIRRPGHCEISYGERSRAFDDLVRWVEEGIRPEGDDVLAPDLTDVGLRFTDPLLPGDPGGF